MSIPPYFSCSIFICSIPRNSKAFVTIVSLIWFFSNMYDLVFDQILPYMIKCLSQGLHSLNLGCTLCYFTRLLFWKKNICHDGCIGMVYHLCVFTDVLPYPYLSTHVLQWNGLSPLWMHCCITETCIWANKIQWVIYYGFSQDCTLWCHTICFLKWYIYDDCCINMFLSSIYSQPCDLIAYLLQV